MTLGSDILEYDRHTVAAVSAENLQGDYSLDFDRDPSTCRRDDCPANVAGVLYAFAGGGFSKYTPDDFTGDVKKFGVYLEEKPIKDIVTQDIQAWISFLKSPSPKGEGLSAKTVSRRLTAIGNFFSWLIASGVVPEKANPMRDIVNTRVTSPLPEILFEEECGRLLAAASSDPRIYLLFMLFLETGIKLEELFQLKVPHFDFSNKYSPEMHVKHVGKKEKKSRKLKLPMEIQTVFQDYLAAYKVDEALLPYTQRFG